MSKSNPSEVKLAVPTSGGFSGLKSLNLQVFVMIAAIIAIILFLSLCAAGPAAFFNRPRYFYNYPFYYPIAAAFCQCAPGYFAGANWLL